MMENIKVAISSDFLTSFARLPRQIQGKVTEFVNRVKGLEFEYVFIAAVNNRIIPLSSAINKTDTVSEAEPITSEKCLLYVAMTRAQKGVYITSYGKKSDFLKP